jgi:hypothetical protein
MAGRIVLALCAVAVACTDWTEWDVVFQRGFLTDEVGDPVPSRHWIGGDGAVSVALPGGGLVWIFGDTEIGDQDPDSGFKTNLTYFPVFGNTVGYLPDAQVAHPEDEIEFFARSSGPSETQPPLERLDIVDITGQSPDGGFFAYFHPEVLGIPEGGIGLADILWPAGGICIDCEGTSPPSPRLILGFTRVEFIPMGENTFSTLVLGSHLVEVTNLAAGPESWTATELTIDGSLGAIDWGKSFVRQGDDVLIYGSDGAGNVHVARAPVSDLFDLTTWEVLVDGGTWTDFTSTIPDDLAVVASGVGAIFTVDEITRGGVTRFALVHVHPVGDHMLFVRMSDDPTHWSELDAETPRLDLVSVDRSLEAAALKADGLVLCTDGTTTCADPILECDLTPENGIIDLDECALSYHGLAHPEISQRDLNGEISNLTVSYVIPSPDLSDDDVESTLEYYVPRFAFVPLSSIEPWCPPASPYCWKGVNHQYAMESLATGETRTFLFDLSDGYTEELAAELGTISGSPVMDVLVEDDEGATEASCDWEGGPPRQVCMIDVPAGAERARITVVAVGQDASFTLRASYDGGQGVFD